MKWMLRFSCPCLCAAVLSGALSSSLHAQTLPATITRLTLSASSVARGTPVLLTAAVSGLPVPQGQVAFCDLTHVAVCTPASANLLGIAQITAAGQATLKLRLGLGTHTLGAHFLGTTAATGSNSSTAKFTVALPSGPLPTITSLAATRPQNVSAGGIYDVAATVATPPGVAPPTGAVGLRVAPPAGAFTFDTLALGSGVEQGPVFVPPATAPSVTGNSAIADFNEDGIPDLAVAGGSGGIVSVLQGYGDGTFPVPSTVNRVQGLCTTACVQVTTADFNSDGHADLVALQAAGTGAATTYALQFAYGSGNGAFTLGPRLVLALTAGSTPPQLVVGDYNGDGQPDLLVNGSATTGADLAVVLQHPGHTFAVSYPKTFGSGGIVPPAYIAPADLNSDGKTDFVGVGSVGGATQQSLLVFLSNGDGTFTAAPFNLANVASAFLPPAVGDVNGDGLPDVLLFSNTGSPVGHGAVLPGDGKGSFGSETFFDEELTPGDIQVVSISAIDVNGDGLSDVLLGMLLDNPAAPESFNALISDGTGLFTTSGFTLPYPVVVSGFPTTPVLAADLDGDGLPDEVFGLSNNGCCAVLINRTGYSVASAAASGVTFPHGGQFPLTGVFAPTGGFASSVSPPILVSGTQVSTTLALKASMPTATAGEPVTLTATLSPVSTPDGFTNNGDLVTFFTGVSLPTATLQNGVASVTVTNLPVGTNSVFAEFGGDATFIPSNASDISVVVTPAEPAPKALAGTYTFEYTGVLPPSYGPTQGGAAVGIFTADGAGNVTGEEDINSAPVTAAKAVLSGTYSLDASGLGTLHLVDSQGLVQDFDMVLSARDSTGVAHSITLLGAGSEGSVSKGSAQLRSGLAPLNTGSYTLRLNGETSCQGSACVPTGHGAGPVSLLGSLEVATSGGSGSAATGTAAQNIAGVLVTDPAVNLVLSSPDASGRYTAKLTGSVLPSGEPTDFVGYAVSATELELLSIDPHTGAILLSGTLTAQ